MLSVLADRTYRHMFLALVTALLGTGLLTVALGLLAYDLAGGRAGIVLGTVFAIKMIAYVGVAPVAGAFVDRVPRRAVLVGLDLFRAAIACLLPFVDQVWQVYVLIFLLQSASAAFTPTFQATIPDILPEEERYTRALSLSRLAYDLENLISPMLAAVLLAVISYHDLFAGTVAGFLGSAVLVLSVKLPAPAPAVPRGIYDRTTRGLRIYLETPRLRGLLALSATVAAAGSMVLVNTVVLVRGELGFGDRHVAVALGVFGGGSMLAALLLPRALQRLGDRRVMIGGAALLALALLGLGAAVAASGLFWWGLLGAWLVAGIGYSAVQTPSGRLLRRSSQQEDRQALFAAQFALSHACWLATYPLAGWLITVSGPVAALAALGFVAIAGIVAAALLWPSAAADEIEHAHDDLPDDHPHVRGERPHRHPYVIDDFHPHWPRQG